MSRFIFLAMAAGVLVASCAVAPSPSSSSGAPQEEKSLIDGYRSWHKVNPKPLQVMSVFAVLCRLTTPEEQKLDATDPHKDKFISVFVNDIGKAAMLKKKPGPFPVGSIIVKEKLPTEQSTTPELMTVMIKREKGFNPDCGDWEFAVFKPSIAKPEGIGKLKNCQQCHTPQKERDYVFANYRPGREFHAYPWALPGNN